ncbi:hypothetical protein IGI04_039589 [Brassica rapa subsp. trilocularis]|uniref:Uncharacterized protein n=1 Tax=Brassica rapa subsp. trilocularis TaxID=1813537 RepID=A0ABQ7KKB0_BRACM|nr:hypothetical protein IGI04_039589 [Brassica rapa subsp. trilocularis]
MAGAGGSPPSLYLLSLCLFLSDLNLRRDTCCSGKFHGVLGGAVSRRKAEVGEISDAPLTATARGSVGDLLHHGSTVWCDGVPNGGVMQRLVKMVLVLGSRGRRVAGFCFNGGVYRRTNSAVGTRWSFTSQRRRLWSRSASPHVRQARLSVRVLSRFMAKERILYLTAMGFFLDLRRQEVKRRFLSGRGRNSFHCGEKYTDELDWVIKDPFQFRLRVPRRY